MAQIECPKCNGSRKIKRPNCLGEGDRIGPRFGDDATFQNRKCNLCNGRGKIGCGYCEGTGFLVY
ncbi:MAG: hypothetical protein COV69_03615 [Parcubacteria group bacterium CG11_big_fil_rev_8_21_14_0_20_39_14]|nr:MAG: hypothetical protein COV69_03615 [Parcubacteria group bacterium CG11_big_fil_rev_8_21_14_0_20_39_14]PIS35595.1 MAG: hypothetical protein COT36_01585 [Parcubacteria group bacterium CG08_land_8_20_14_0_20_38_56]